MYAALEGRGGQLWSNNEVVLWLAGYERKGGKRRSPGNDMTAESQSLFFFFLRLLSVDRKFDLLLHRGGAGTGEACTSFGGPWRMVRCLNIEFGAKTITIFFHLQLFDLFPGLACPSFRTTIHTLFRNFILFFQIGKGRGAGRPSRKALAGSLVGSRHLFHSR